VEDVKAWDLERRETLKHISFTKMNDKLVPVCPADTKDDFEGFKALLIAKLEFELNRMRSREAKRRGEVPVDGITIEHKLQYIIELLHLKGRRNRNVFHGIASTIDQCFSKEQRRLIFELLDEIEDQGYWPVKRAKTHAWIAYLSRRQDREVPC
jgi:hypothetical protein